MYDQISDDLIELARRPKGTHIGELDASWLDGSLPAQFAMNYDYEFMYRLRAVVTRLRDRFNAGNLVAYTVLEEVALYLVFQTAELYEDLYPDDFGPDSDWLDWLGDILGDLDVEMYLFSRSADIRPGFTYHFERWSEEQFWTGSDEDLTE